MNWHCNTSSWHIPRVVYAILSQQIRSLTLPRNRFQWRRIRINQMRFPRPFPGRLTLIGMPPYLRHLLLRQLHLRSANIFLQLVSRNPPTPGSRTNLQHRNPLRPRDHKKVLSLRQYPRQRQLSGRAPFPHRHLRNSLNKLQILWKILIREPRLPTISHTHREGVGRRVP